MDVAADSESRLEAHEREVVLRVMAGAAFLVLFQAYLVAPLIPSMSKEFGASERAVGWLVPAYMLPYGFSTLFYGPISDWLGRKGVLLTMLGGIILAMLGTAGARTLGGLMAWRVFAGVVSGGIVPITLALLGDLFPFEKRGWAFGWIFGALAGGTAFGSTLGAFLNPIVGWRVVILFVAAADAVVFALAWKHRAFLEGRKSVRPKGVREVVAGYASLIKMPRGQRVYSYIFLNAMFHSGVFTWLGLYFSRRYGLGDQGIGLALLGYGVPGMLLGPVIGRAADKMGRGRIIPLGVMAAGTAALLLAPTVPLAVAVGAVTLLSFGYDMSHPLLAGILTSLDPDKRGLAMGLNALALFNGFGLGALVFGVLLGHGLGMAMGVFGAVQIGIGVLAIGVFKRERAAGD